LASGRKLTLASAPFSTITKRSRSSSGEIVPKPKAPHPKIKLHIALPQELVARLRIEFASADHAYGFRPGAISHFIEMAIREQFARLDQIGAQRTRKGQEVER